MVRRVNIFSSSRFLFAAFSVLCLGASLPGQTNAASHSLTPTTWRFIVPSSFALSSSPTSAAVGDVNGDGRPDLVLTEKGSGSVTVMLGDGKGGFAAGVQYPAGTLAGNVQLADLNRDGKLDLVVTDSASGAVDVLFGNGDGTFAKAVSYPALAGPAALAVGNFAGNGKIDLAVAGAGGLAVLINDGTGHFSTPASIALTAAAQSLTAADLRGAGHDDAILANADGSVTVLLNDGSGSLHVQPAFSAASGSLSGIVAGDFNGDGKPDLALTAPGASSVLVLLGHGDGTFAPGVSYAVGNSPASLLAADFTGSGVLDLVSVNQAANTFSVLMGNGDGTFRPSSDFTAGNGPLAAAVGDFNNDGHADLAIANYTGATVSVPLGHADGSFSAPRAYRADLNTRAIASGDLNGDGHPDLVAANYCGADPSCAGNGSATVFLANANGTYRAASTLALGSGPVAVGLADVNGDKKLDLVALNRNDKTLAVLLGNGDGTFGTAQLYTLSSSPRALFVGDLNGDGIPDLAIASDCGQSTCAQPGSLDIWLGHAGGTFSQAASYVAGFSPVSIAAADLRSTGHLDLVVANACGDDATCKSPGTATLFAGDGAGRFTQSGEISIGSSPSSIAIANLFGSGLDLAVAQRGSNQLSVFPANGSGSFGAPAAYAVGNAPSALSIADFNGDGKLDVAVANFQDSTVSVLYGNSSGALSSATSYPVGSGPEALVALSKAVGQPSSLISANGNTGSNPIGNQITSLGGTDPGTGTTTVAITSTANSINVDQQATLQATVTAVAPATPTPTGYVVFVIDNGGGSFTTLTDCNDGSGGETLNGSGVAGCTTQLLPAGSPNVQAQYQGDPIYAANDSADQAQTIAQTGTLVTVGSGTGTVDQSLTLAATIAPNPAPTVTTDIVPFDAADTVTFLNSATAITDCEGEAISLTTTGASSSCSTTSLAAGSYSINAELLSSADVNYAGSTSPAAGTYVVSPANTTVTVNSASPASPTVDQQISVTATVAPNPGSVVIPFSGTMEFFFGTSTPITGCTSIAVNTTTGVATCPIAAGLAANSYSINAEYNGNAADTNYNAGSSTVALPVTVTKAATSVAIAPASQSSSVDGSVTLTATVSPNVATDSVTAANVQSMSGTVSFSDSLNGGAASSITSCANESVTFSSTTGTATATCTPTGLLAGSNSITATYSGTADPNYSSSPASSAATVSVAKASTSIPTFTSSTGGASNVNTSVTFTATVQAPAGATVALGNGGDVEFTDNGTPIAACGGLNGVAVSGWNATTATATAACTTSTLTGGSHSILAQYQNDPNYGTSLNAVTQVVTAISSGTSLISSATGTGPSAYTAVVNQSITLTATVQPANGAVGLSGTVTFTDGAGSVAGCTVAFNTATGVATCTTASLAVGSHTITAKYAQDTSYTASSAAITQVITTGSTSLALSTTNSAPPVNQQVTLTATVTAAAPGSSPTQLSGSVTFTDTPQGGTAATICSNVAVTPTTGKATCTDSWSTAGSHTITATYGSDNNFTGSSNTTPETVGAAGTTLTLTSSGSPSGVNQSPAVVFTATIKENPVGSAGLTGTASFFDTPKSGTMTAIAGCTNLAPSATSPSGIATATCTDAALTASGSVHTITAYYGTPPYSTTDPNFGGSSNTTTQTVNVANSGVVITNPVEPSSVNQQVTFTATVTPSPSGSVALSGSVTFTDTFTPQGSTTANAPVTLCAASAVSVSGSGTGVVSCSSATLALGKHVITASYGSDANFNASSTTFTQNVNSATSTIGLSSSGSAATTVNDSVTFTANIPVPAGSAVLTGTVAFTDSALPTPGTITGCSAVAPKQTSSTNWAATCADASLTAGSHTITASYGGDANFTVGSGSLVQAVKQASTSLVISSSTNPSAINTSVTITATITPNPAGNTALSGTVTFNDAYTPLGSTTANPTVTLCTGVALSINGSGTGTATCASATLGLGTHAITAYYGTTPAPVDANFVGSSSTLTQTVNAAAASMSLTSTQASSQVNQSVTFTAQITAPGGNAVLVGTLAFTDSALPTPGIIPGCSAVAPTQTNTTTWQASCPDASLSAGSHTISVTYNGDKNFSVGKATTTQTVSAAPSALVLTSLEPTVVDGGAVTFSASVTPFNGTVALTGSVAFTVNGSPITCGSTSKPFNPATGVATCVTTATVVPGGTTGFVDGQGNTIAATYSADLNYSASTNSISEDVEDYSILVKSVLTGAIGVPVIAGTTSANDPFADITLSSTSFGGYSGAPTVTCSSAQTGAPACDLASTTLQVVPGGAGSVSIVIDASASGVAAGTYTYTVSAKDSVTGLARTATFTVNVLPASSTLTVVSGTPGTGTVNFPSGVTLSNLTCLDIAVAGSTTTESPSAFGVSCTNFAAGSAAGAWSFTVNTNGTITAMNTRESGSGHSGLLVAGLFGIPIFGLLGILRGRKRIRSDIFRLVILLAVGIAAMQAMGCGGSFSPNGSTTTSSKGTTPPGTYYLLVQGTSGGTSYDAVLQVVVTVN
jgi:large repetitive protein